MKTALTLLACLLAMAISAGCNDDEFDEGADRARLEAMETAIDDYIGENACDKPDGCRVIAFGAKPCGGPWSYKAFNIAEIDSATLVGMVDEYNRFNAVLNERYGWMSDCMFVEEPGVDCFDGHCIPISFPEPRTH